MSKKEKLVKRFLQMPNDFTFDELIALFGYFGFHLKNKGATSGSRVVFIKGDISFIMHKPHPGNVVGRPYLKRVYVLLRLNELM